MASFTGITLAADIVSVLPNSALLDVLPIDFALLAYLDGGANIYGTKANVATVMPIDDKGGITLPDYADLWYNHIHILPNRINVGNLTSQQVRPIEIFNGYFSSVTLNTVTNNGLSGVGFAVTTPLVLAALQSVYKNLTIDVVGAPEFNGNFELQFNTSTHFLYVTGKRVLVMPFQHNWNSKVIERLAWFNTSAKSLAGIEQIIMLRKYPRRTLDYDVLLVSSQTNAPKLRALFQSLMFGWQNRVFAVPVWTDATRLSVSATAGQNIVAVNPTNFDYDVGSYVMLWQNEEKYELVEIQSVATDHLVLAINLADTWAANRTVVLPARLGIISPNINGIKHTLDIDSVPLTFELLPEYPSLNRLVGSTRVLYRGAHVLLTKNNYAGDNKFNISRNIVRNDATVGRFSIETVQPAPDTNSSFSFIFANHQQMADFYAWLNTRKGRVNIFWQPTWSNDMQVIQNISGASNNLLINNINYNSLYKINSLPAYTRRDIMIILKNGTYFFRRITGAAANLDNTETIGIDTVLGQDVSVADIDRICFLIPSALDADAVEIAWENGNISQTQIMVADVYDNTL